MQTSNVPPVFQPPVAKPPRADRTGCILAAVLAAVVGLPIMFIFAAVAILMMVALLHRDSSGPDGDDAAAGIAHVTDGTFDRDVLSADLPGPILVDFYADWCGPCRSQGKILKRFAAENQEVTVVKVDVDTNRGLSARYKVEAIPTLLIVRNGKVTARHTGLASESELKRLLNRKAGSTGPT